MRKYARIAVLCLLVMAGTACSPDEDVMHNGYYSAVASSFNEHGWKEFITLYVYNNRIITAEYNARNASGLVLSWDVFAIRRYKEKTRVHPNRIFREYTQELLNRQGVSGIRKVRGDLHFYEAFVKLATAAIDRAKAGDGALAEVLLEEPAAAKQ